MPRQSRPAVDAAIIKRIRVLLAERDISRKDFGRRLRISETMLSRCLHGHVRFSIGTVMAICSLFDVPPCWLMGGGKCSCDEVATGVLVKPIVPGAAAAAQIAKEP